MDHSLAPALSRPHVCATCGRQVRFPLERQVCELLVLSYAWITVQKIATLLSGIHARSRPVIALQFKCL
jgi:hypothetical protein